MANKLMTRSEAKLCCERYGYPEFIDVCVKNKMIIVEDNPKLETLYQQHFNDTWGTISLLMRGDELELWIGGKFRYKCVRKDV